MNRRLFVLVILLLSVAGCSQTRKNLSLCTAARERLTVELESLRHDNERLLAEKRSQTHRLAEVEKQLARQAQSDQPEQSNWSPAGVASKPYVVEPQGPVTERRESGPRTTGWRAK